MHLPFRAVCRCFVALLPVLTLLAAPAHAAASEPTAASLEFIQNKGQWDRRVRYQAALPAGRLFVQADALTYTFLDPAALSQHHEGARARPAGANAGAATADIAAHAYTVHFERANPQVRLSAEGPTAGERNYFVGADATRWASHVGAFRRLRYTELWPGIDLTLYENATQHLEYDVLLAPRANPARVALRYDGARDLALNAAGNLVINTTVSTTTELAPKAWQLDAAGRPQAVACRYVLTGRTITFALGPYDKSRALTIDPTVQFSTLTGSTADNWGFTATYDNAGNMYSGGIVFNSGGMFPATPGAYRTSFSSVVDMAIIKYNTQLTGSASRVWATYLGGNEADFPHSLVVNGQNELVILGSTSSTNYPTTAGVMQSRFGGGTALDPFGSGQAPYLMPNGSDLVITRLNATGSGLVASTYFGGSGNDGVVGQPRAIGANYGDAFRSDVLLDGAGNVYIAAATSSANLMGLSRGFNPTYRGGPADALVSKLAPGLDAAVWTGFLGGTGADAAYSVQRDGQGRVYVCGGTTSTNFPTTTSAYLTDAPGGGTDGFAARISPDGHTLERATFIGTDGYDQAYFLQLDATGHPYLFGQTLGQVAIPDGLYGEVGGTQFIQKLDPDLTASVYNTVFGNRAGPRGGPNLVPTAFLVDDCERVYISGWGGNTNNAWLGGNTAGLPVTSNAMQGTTDGSDFYLAQFAAGMTSLEYGTFYGQQGGRGEHVDGGTSRFDKRGVVYQAVCASCGGTQGFPVPPGAGSYSTRNGSANCNNAAFKINFEVVQADPGPRRYVCVDDGNISLSGSPAGGVWSGPGVVALPGGGYQFVPAAVGAGQYLINYTVQATGTCQSTRAVRYLVAPAVVPAFAPVPPQCTTMPILILSATPAGGAFSGPGVSSGRFNPAAAGAGTHTLTYAVSDSLGCGVITQQVVVSRPPVVSVGLDTTLCADLRQPFQLHGSPAGGVWSGTGVSATGFFTPPDTNNRGGVFPITYTVVDGACQAAATQQVILAPTSAQDVGLNLPVCAAAPQYTGLAPFKIVLTPVLLYDKAVYLWDFGDSTPTSSEATPTHTYQQPGTYKVTLTARYGNCEVLTGFAPVVVGDVFVPNIITPNNDELNQTFQPRFSCRPASLEVFSRWGQRVYQTYNYQNNWDAKGVPNGIYYYLLRDADDRRVKGWVEVRR